MISKEVIRYERKQEDTQKPASDETTEKITTSYQLYHHNHIGNTMYTTDITGKKTAEYTYGPYGELTGAKDLKNDRTTEGTDGNSLLEGIQERFLFQGKYGVETEYNGLYYMRTRYYNADIKRFISRDVVTGSIADSNSLNRYTYVEGNLISKTDPFGLSPDISFTEMGHSMLDAFGFIPGYGDATDLVNATTYYMEGDIAAGTGSLICAIPIIGSFLGQGLKAIKQGAKIGKTVTKATRAVGNAAEVATDVLRTSKETVKTAIRGSSTGVIRKGAEIATKLTTSMGNGVKKGITQLKKAGTKVQAAVGGPRKKPKKSDRKTDFYVKPNGDVVPGTGYRYSARNSSVVENAKKGTIMARSDGTYFSFDKYEDAIIAQGKLQIPYRPEYRIAFNTIDIVEDINIPYGQWGKASYLEPITKDYKKFGPGKATQAITYSQINSVSEIYR